MRAMKIIPYCLSQVLFFGIIPEGNIFSKPLECSVRTEGKENEVLEAFKVGVRLHKGLLLRHLPKLPSEDGPCPEDGGEA